MIKNGCIAWTLYPPFTPLCTTSRTSKNNTGRPHEHALTCADSHAGNDTGSVRLSTSTMGGKVSRRHSKQSLNACGQGHRQRAPKAHPLDAGYHRNTTRAQPSAAGSSVFFNMSHDVPSVKEVHLLRATAAAVFGSGSSPAQWIIEPVVERRVESLQPTGFFEAVIQIAANRDDDG